MVVIFTEMHRFYYDSKIFICTVSYLPLYCTSLQSSFDYIDFLNEALTQKVNNNSTKYKWLSLDR
jgi:hypothetical protein